MHWIPASGASSTIFYAVTITFCSNTSWAAPYPLTRLPPMSSTRYAQALRLKPKPSRILIGLLTVGHLGAVVVVFFLDIPLMVKLLIAVALLVSLIVAWRKQPGSTGEGGIRALTWRVDGEWLLETIGGESIIATLHESTYVHPWLVVLNFRQAEKRGLISFVLAPDALDRETFRELRVRLKVAGDSGEKREEE